MPVIIYITMATYSVSYQLEMHGCWGVVTASRHCASMAAIPSRHSSRCEPFYADVCAGARARARVFACMMMVMMMLTAMMMTMTQMHNNAGLAVRRV